MLVTDLAMRDMSERHEAFFARVGRWFATTFHTAAVPPAMEGRAVDRPVPGEETPHLARDTESNAGPIDFVRHRSRTNCKRAIQLAHRHRFAEARSAFHTAFATEPRLDPGDMADFWTMPRRGLFAAIEAYEDLGRYHDAAVLEVRILQSSRSNVLELQQSPTPTPASR
jgi:hypothetical protein